jgi:hypothetical protein
MGRIGCLAALVLALVAGVLVWMFVPSVRDRFGARPVTSVDSARWEPVTPAGAARARAEIAKLADRSGPVYANIGPGDLSAYVFEEMKRSLPPSTHITEATVVGDTLYVRGSIRLSDLGGAGSLGPLGSMLADSERVQFGGTLGVLRPGLAEYRLKALRVRDFDLRVAIQRIVRQMEQGPRPDGLAPDALPLVTPTHIADVRVGKGKVTLYKQVQR